jgi:Zn finger protein HypA/HybF involved in hydrogenase expression
VIQFECLRCGRVSHVELESVDPSCSRCGSGTGVLGDIGQGTPEERLRRRAGAEGGAAGVNFECLQCGAVTEIRQQDLRRPECPHCGSRSGVVVNEKPS